MSLVLPLRSEIAKDYLMSFCLRVDVKNCKELKDKLTTQITLNCREIGCGQYQADLYFKASATLSLRPVLVNIDVR